MTNKEKAAMLLVEAASILNESKSRTSDYDSATIKIARRSINQEELHRRKIEAIDEKYRIESEFTNKIVNKINSCKTYGSCMKLMVRMGAYERKLKEVGSRKYEPAYNKLRRKMDELRG